MTDQRSFTDTETVRLDVIDELRQTAGHLINGTIEDVEVSALMLCEAADELERIRAAAQAVPEAMTLADRIGKTYRKGAGPQAYSVGELSLDDLNLICASLRAAPQPCDPPAYRAKEPVLSDDVLNLALSEFFDKSPRNTFSDSRRVAMRKAILTALSSVSSTPLKTAAPEPTRWPAKGDQMKFLGVNGYPFQLEEAKKIFTVGEVYRVHACNVESWSHGVQFDGVKGWFNGVMFERTTEHPSTPDGSAPEKLCDCFGDSGLQASTYSDGKRRCCDLCGLPVASMSSTDREGGK